METSFLRTEYTGAIAILLILYAIQVHMGPENTVDGEITIWLDNAEVLSRARRRRIGKEIKDNLVFDFDIWMGMEALLDCLRFPITWER